MHGIPTLIPTLDELAADPSKVASLSVEIRTNLIARLSALIFALTTTGATRAEEAVPARAEEPERLLKVQEAARMLGFAPGSIYELARRRALPSVRRGKYVRFRLSTLRRFHLQQRAGVDKSL